jgi:hypothetical protein
MIIQFLTTGATPEVQNASPKPCFTNPERRNTMAAPAIAALAARALPALQNVAKDLAPDLARGAGSALMEHGLKGLGGSNQEPVNYAGNDAKREPAVY